MPGVTLHLYLAERTLAFWQTRRSAPFPLGDRAAVNAFRQGSFGPDIGYFPGGPTHLSDLAHAVKSAELCRSLVRLARSPVERAYAWGWVGHVLADVAVHPILGCAVGELVYGTAGRFVEGDRNPQAHGRVEAGLDAVFALRRPALRRRPPEPVFDGDSIGYLAAAYRETHGVSLEHASLLRAHRGAARRAAQGLILAGLTSPLVSGRPGLRTGERESRLRRRFSASWLAIAYLLPVKPPRWLLAWAGRVARSFPRILSEAWRSGLDSLENRNLDTGALDCDAYAHGAAVRGRSYLASASADLASAA
jgi:hypothetical protein